MAETRKIPKMAVFCSGPTCDLVISGRTQLTCTGCDTKSYCSTKCQGDDRPSEHDDTASPKDDHHVLTSHAGHQRFCNIPGTVYAIAARVLIRRTYHLFVLYALDQLGFFKLRALRSTSADAREVWRRQSTKIGFVVNIAFDLPESSELYTRYPAWFHARITGFGGKVDLAQLQETSGRDVVASMVDRIESFNVDHPKCEGVCIVFRVPISMHSPLTTTETFCGHFRWDHPAFLSHAPWSLLHVLELQSDLNTFVDDRRDRALRELHKAQAEAEDDARQKMQEKKREAAKAKKLRQRVNKSARANGASS